jgi:GT2 family glycosyltransferase
VSRRTTFRIDAASLLSDDVLLLVANLPERVQRADGRLRAVVDGDSLEMRVLRFAPVNAGPNALLTAQLPDREPGRESPDRVTVAWGDTAASADLSESLVDLRACARLLGDLPASTRNAILEFLTGTLEGDSGAGAAARLHKSLVVLRDALRERLPACVLVKEEPQALAAEVVLAIDDRAFYVKGWLHDEDGTGRRLTAVAPEGMRTELFEGLFRHRRVDIEYFYGRGADLGRKHGFVAYFELDAPSSLQTGWVFEMANATGEGVETRAPAVVREHASVRDTILRDLEYEPAGSETLTTRCIHPALSRMQERARNGVEIESVQSQGSPPDDVDVSVIVPLYRRIDLLEHQLAQFADDPEIHAADLVFVLDSPELAPALTEFARELHALYRVPFRVAVLARNAGYSGANNAGAALARGRLLLLLNSDIVPARRGWLGALASFYESTGGIGALGPKLVYEDDSLQHAGLYFRRPPGLSTWENAHYFKGLHRELPAANVTRPVPAVTGACLMIDKERYEAVGGLRGLYVQGDNEDSDLCLRLLEAGCRNWYLPEVELYHLEGQSYPPESRKLTRRYNDWLQTRLWSDAIEEVMVAHAEPAHEAVVVHDD